MKIAVFSDTYLPQINGVVTSIITFADAFEKLGHQVVIIAPRIGKEYRFTDRVWRFRSMTFPFQAEHRISLPWSRKLRQFDQYGFDIIHAQTPFTMGYIAQRLARKYQIPLVHTYHTLFSEYIHYLPLVPKNIMRRYVYSESRRFCNHCEYIIVPSCAIKNQLESYGVKKPIEIIPTGIDLNDFPKDPNIIRFKNQHGFSDSDRILIFVGRLAVEKNVYFLLEAFLKLSQQFSDVKLLIVGDGPERKKMSEFVADHQLNERVVFTGYINRDKVFTAFQSSYCCVFPSKTETQGLIVLEALAAGIPAVCLNAMGVKDILQGNKGGFLTNNSLSEFTESITLLLQDAELYHQKREEAKARAQFFSSESLARKMLNVFDFAIQQNKEGKDVKLRV